MKIGYFITHYPYDSDYEDYFCGGTGEVAVNLVREMDLNGHEVHIFTTSRSKKYEFEKKGKVYIHRYGKIFRVAESYISLTLLIRPLRYDVDIVHSHMGNAPAPVAALIYSIIKNKPLITTYHGDQQCNYGSAIRRICVFLYSILFVKLILSFSDYIISPTKKFISQSKLLSQIKKDIVVIPNGINLSEFLITESKVECRKKLNLPLKNTIILFLGSINENKGPHILLKAFNKIIENGYTNFSLVFVGDGLFRKKLQKMADDLSLSNYVRFEGYQVDKYSYYRAADIFVLPSIMKNEIFGIVNLEAMSMGIPIIASDIGGVSEVVTHGVTGLLVKPNNPQEIYDSIVVLTQNPKLVAKLSNNGMLNVKNYSWSNIAKKTINLYKDSINKNLGIVN